MFILSVIMDICFCDDAISPSSATEPTAFRSKVFSKSLAFFNIAHLGRSAHLCRSGHLNFAGRDSGAKFDQRLLRQISSMVNLNIKYSNSHTPEPKGSVDLRVDGRTDGSAEGPGGAPPSPDPSLLSGFANMARAEAFSKL